MVGEPVDIPCCDTRSERKVKGESTQLEARLTTYILSAVYFLQVVRIEL
jgi:hypothetical protein